MSKIEEHPDLVIGLHNSLNKDGTDFRSDDDKEKEKKEEEEESFEFSDEPIKKKEPKKEPPKPPVQEERPETISISDESRQSSIMVIGAKNSGKSQYVIPMFAKQDFQQKDTGMTIIVGQRDMAYLLYAMAKKAKRKVVLLKPEINFDILSELLWAPEWDYDYINDNVINYAKAIHDKEIVIIDMEYYHYRTNAVRATSMLLMQLVTDMAAVQETGKYRHFVYVDNAERYLPFLELLLTDGSSYNMSTILFFQGRNTFKAYGTDYTTMLDNNVMNTILMPNLNWEDTQYYASRLCPANWPIKKFLPHFYKREYTRFAYDIINDAFERQTGSDGHLFIIKEDEMEGYRKAARKYRKELKQDFREDTALRKSLMQEEERQLNIRKSKETKKVYPTFSGSSTEEEPVYEVPSVNPMERVMEKTEKSIDQEEEVTRHEVHPEEHFSGDNEEIEIPLTSPIPEEDPAEEILEKAGEFEGDTEDYLARIEDAFSGEMPEADSDSLEPETEELEEEIPEAEPDDDEFPEFQKILEKSEASADKEEKRSREMADALVPEEDKEIVIDIKPQANITSNRNSFFARPVKLLRVRSQEDQFNKALKDLGI